MSGLPKGWVETTVADLNDRKSNNIKPLDYPDEIFELYSVPIFPTGVPEEVFGKDIGSSKQIVQEDDVLLCKINPRINRVWQVAKKRKLRQISSSEWIVIRQPLIQTKYLKYYFSEYKFRDLLCSDVTGVGGSLTRAQPKKVATYPVLLAPLNEQIRIANKLDSLLAKVEATQKHLDKIPTLLKRFRQSVLAAAVSGELTKEWRIQNGLNLKLQKEALVNILENIQIGPFGSLLHKSDYVAGEIPIINPMHINGGRISPSIGMTISKEKHAELQRYHLKEGDVILGRRGEMGRAAVVKKDQKGWLCGTGSLFLRFNHEVIDPYFLWLVMSSPTTITDLISSSVGSTMVNLNQKILKNLLINFPNIKEQKQIVKRVEALFTLADKVEQQYQAAKQRTDRLTQSILAKAFRGELVPQDPNDEPASELLKRIQAET